MSAVLAFLTTVAFCVAAFLLMRGSVKSLRDGLTEAFGLMREANQHIPQLTRAAVLKISAAVLLAGVLAALTACGEKKNTEPAQVDQNLVEWFAAHETEARAELKRCYEVGRTKSPDWRTTPEGLRCQAADLASYRFAAAPLDKPRYFQGGSK